MGHWLDVEAFFFHSRRSLNSRQHFPLLEESWSAVEARALFAFETHQDKHYETFYSQPSTGLGDPRARDAAEAAPSDAVVVGEHSSSSSTLPFVAVASHRRRFGVFLPLDSRFVSSRS